MTVGIANLRMTKIQGDRRLKPRVERLARRAGDCIRSEIAARWITAPVRL
jgi:hypothetical protein